jgi:hypothetical protein
LICDGVIVICSTSCCRVACRHFDQCYFHGRRCRCCVRVVGSSSCIDPFVYLCGIRR